MSLVSNRDLYINISSHLPFEDQGKLPLVCKKLKEFDNNDAFWTPLLKERGLVAEPGYARSMLVSHLRNHCSLFFELRKVKPEEKVNIFVLYTKIIQDSDYTAFAKKEFDEFRNRTEYKDRKDSILRAFAEQNKSITAKSICFELVDIQKASDIMIRFLIQKGATFLTADLVKAFCSGRPDDIICLMTDQVTGKNDSPWYSNPLDSIRSRENNVPEKAVAKMIEKFPVTKRILYEAVEQKYPEQLLAKMAEKAADDTSWATADPIDWLLKNLYSEALIVEFLKYQKQLYFKHLETAIERSFSADTLRTMLQHIAKVNYRTIELAANNANGTSGYLIASTATLRTTQLPDDILIAMIDKCEDIQDLEFHVIIGRVSSAVMKHMLIKGAKTVHYDVYELMRRGCDEQLVLFFIQHHVEDKKVYDNYLEIAKEKKYSQAVINALKKKYHNDTCIIA